MLLAARTNRLLAALPEPDLRRLLRHLQLVEMKRGAVLHGGTSLSTSHAYFPTTSIVSLRYGVPSEHAPEVAVVGHDGVVGMSIFLGGEGPPGSAVVLVEGWGFRVAAEALREECIGDSPLLPLLLRSTHALIAQMAQTSICNQLHSVEARFTRRLLLCADRVSEQELPMTHELMARGLGVRRSGVTEAAINLQQLGLIRYVRGRIAILDRLGLERRVCSCYALISESLERLLPAPRRRAQVVGQRHP